MRAFGNLIDDAEAAYQTDPKGLFYAEPGKGDSLRPQFYNGNVSYIVPVNGVFASKQVLPSNPKRVLLLIQNQSTSQNMYLNFGSSATVNNAIVLTPGVGLVFDNSGNSCPSDSVHIAFAAASQTGVVMEVRAP